MLKLQSHKASNIWFNLFQPSKKEVGTLRKIHKDKQAHKQEKEREIGKERTNKTARVKGGEENERQMANNVNVREMSLWWVLGMSWLERRPPQQRCQKFFSLRLVLALVLLEEERVMQQSSVSISLSFWEPRYQSSRRLRASPSHLQKTNKSSQPTQ